MAQDIRKMLSDDSSDKKSLSKDHESRFLQKLEEQLPQEKTSKTSSNVGISYVMKIAALFIVAGGMVWMVYTNAFAKADSNGTNGGDSNPSQIVETKVVADEINDPQISLSALSPEFKKIEDFYLASVNLELARLDITDDNKELIDAFMKQLAELDAEYKKLNREIVESGVSEEMVSAMIENLKLRVELMVKLKAKLKEIKAEANAAEQQIT